MGLYFRQVYSSQHSKPTCDMDMLYRYFAPLVEYIYSWWNGSSSTPANSSTANQNQAEPSESTKQNDIPVTKPSQTFVSEVQEGSRPAQTTVNSHSGYSDHTHMPLQYSSSYTHPDETAKVDRINLFVKCAGKTKEVDMYPMQRISDLLTDACDWAGKKPEKMSLVYEGNHLDVNKTVSQYGLRGGTTIHLIHA